MKFYLRKNATTVAIRYRVLHGLASDIATAVAVFVAKNPDGELMFDDGPATISDVFTAADGTKGATLSFSQASLISENVGVNFSGYFSLSYPSGASESVPRAGDVYWTVSDDFSGLDPEADSTPLQGSLQTQAGHGFAIFDLVRWTGTEWTKAIADSDTTVAQAMVVSVESDSMFRVVYLSNREVTMAAHGKGAGGTKLYLSQSVAGQMTSTRPVEYPIQQVGLVKDANVLILQAYPLEAA